MIISHKYEYLFVALPRTASTAVSKELCDNYAGEPILHKHAHYHEFLKIASAKQRAYFVFSGIRNPLDDAVSHFFKLKTDHNGEISNPRNWQRNGGYITEAQLRAFNFIQNNDADFATYFKIFYKFPYDNWSALAHHKFDFIIRFESLQDGFRKALELLGIEQIRPLPAENRTGARGKDFLEYYVPEIQDRARWIFGPFMEKWGYEFPSEWGSKSVPRSSRILFNVLAIVRTRLIWRPSPYAQLFTRFRRLSRGYF